MSFSLRTVGKQSLIYGAGMLMGRAVGFLLLPIYTRFLTPGDYGVLELLEMTTEFAGMAAGLGLVVAMTKQHADEPDEDKRGIILSTAAIAQFGVAAVAAILGIVFARQVSDILFSTTDHAFWVRLAFAAYLARAASIVSTTTMRIWGKAMLYVGVNLTQLVLAVSANILLVVIFQMGVAGVLVGGLIVQTALAVFLNWYLFWKTRSVGSFSVLAGLVRYGYPLVFGMFGSFVLTFSDRFFLNHFQGAEAVGNYALAYRFAFVVGTAISPFWLVWGPQRFTVAHQEDAKETFSRVFFLLNVYLCGVAITVTLLVGDVIHIMAAPEFWSAHAVVPLLIVSQVFQAWTQYSQVGLLVEGRTGRVGWIAALSAVVVTGANLLLIPFFGVMGAAWATAVVFGIRFWLTYSSAQAVYFVPYPWRRLALLYAVAGSAYGIHELFPIDSVVGSLSFNVTLLLVAGLATAGLVLHDRERKQCASLVKDLGMRLRALR